MRPISIPKELEISKTSPINGILSLISLPGMFGLHEWQKPSRLEVWWPGLWKKSVQSKETGLQFFKFRRSPFFGSRVMIALLQLRGSKPLCRLSVTTSRKSSPITDRFVELNRKTINARSFATLKTHQSSIKFMQSCLSLQFSIGFSCHLRESFEETTLRQKGPYNSWQQMSWSQKDLRLWSHCQTLESE